MAKKLGITEQQIKDSYTMDELVERFLFDTYETYIFDEMNK